MLILIAGALGLDEILPRTLAASSIEGTAC